ncbi:MAG: tetratricopeptide repeat protein [Chloroflexi bacterium]|nr:tetratricopeptide repeat protein [Chloroflexota bacterium]
MNTNQVEEKEKAKKDQAKKAVALAMERRWEEAVSVNSAIVEDFPEELEAYNRLGKALSELGRNREAGDAFRRALEISPYNSIAKKNLQRLETFKETETFSTTKDSVPPQTFIGESGKAGVTSLMSLAPPKELLKLSPGQSVDLRLEGGKLVITSPAGEYVGKLEPRLSSRLSKLIEGGNRYEVSVAGVGEQELKVIISEVYKHPSQSGVVSFPLKESGLDYRVYLPGAVAGFEGSDDDATDEPVLTVLKDWSDDDTEPGDDEAFTPAFQRIVNSPEGENEDDEY